MLGQDSALQSHRIVSRPIYRFKAYVELATDAAQRWLPPDAELNLCSLPAGSNWHDVSAVHAKNVAVCRTPLPCRSFLARTRNSHEAASVTLSCSVLDLNRLAEAAITASCATYEIQQISRAPSIAGQWSRRHGASPEISEAFAMKYSQRSSPAWLRVPSFHALPSLVPGVLHHPQ